LRKSSGIVTKQSDAEMVLSAPLLAEVPWLVHGFSTRLGGVSSFDTAPPSRAGRDLNLGKVAWDTPENVGENRRRFQQSLQASSMQLVTLRQIHSELTHIIDGSVPAAGDGMVTARPGLLLSILAADCLPILIADVRQKVVGAVHCGWRGTVRAIALKTVGLMKWKFGSKDPDLRAAIGPGIRGCCYKVGAEVAEEFEGQFVYAAKLLTRKADQTALEAKYSRLFKTYKSFDEVPESPQLYLDLVLANVTQLHEAGVAPSHVYADAPCTSCHPELFFSHRRDAGYTGRMMGAIGIRI
jgi:YfiH family protein